MSSYNVVSKRESIDTGKDSVVIVKFGQDLVGGRTLDVTGYANSVIHAGHIIITDGNGIYKPLPINGEGYDTLPEGYAYAGVLYRSILTTEPAASILIDATVNESCLPFPLGTQASAIKAALPHIIWVKDEVEN